MRIMLSTFVIGAVGALPLGLGGADCCTNCPAPGNTCSFGSWAAGCGSCFKIKQACEAQQGSGIIVTCGTDVGCNQDDHHPTDICTIAATEPPPPSPPPSPPSPPSPPNSPPFPVDECPPCKKIVNSLHSSAANSCCSTNNNQVKCPRAGAESWWCPPCQVAKAWKEYDGGKNKEDCANALAIAMGEGINPNRANAQTCTSDDDCLNVGDHCDVDNKCSRNDDDPVKADFDRTTYCLDQVAWDQYSTVGPWQSKCMDEPNGCDIRGSGTGVDLQKRIEQVFGYMENPAGNGNTFDCPNLAPDSQGSTSEENGYACSGPLASGQQYTPTTIFKSHVEPPII